METTSKATGSRLISRRAFPPRATIFGQSKEMKELERTVEKVAGARVPILILGETGTGKEVLARFIHSLSPGETAPFLNMSPLLPGGRALDEVEFRFEPPGTGWQEESSGIGNSERRLCTLFVKELSLIGPYRQLELLQMMQGFKPFISSDGTEIPVALRIIATSAHDLQQEVTAGNFRQDLFSMFGVVKLHVLPLRERRQDIPDLADHFWRIYSRKFGCRPARPSPKFIGRLQRHDWPGNIRELENVMKRYVVLGWEGIEGIGHSLRNERPVAPVPAAGCSLSLKDVTREAAQALERKIILRTLRETRWNRRRAARALNISYRALLYKMKAAGLSSEQPGNPAAPAERNKPKQDQNAA